MARLSGSVLGNLSGKLGNLAARTINGSTVLEARPSSFAVSQSPQSVSVRKKFRVTTKLAKSIVHLDDLKSIWNIARLPGLSAFNTVVKNNFAFSDEDKPSEQNALTPGG